MFYSRPDKLGLINIAAAGYLNKENQLTALYRMQLNRPLQVRG